MIKETEHQSTNSNVIEFRSRVKNNAFTESSETELNDKSLTSEIENAIKDQTDTDELFVVLNELATEPIDLNEEVASKPLIRANPELDISDESSSRFENELDSNFLDKTHQLENLTENQKQDSHLSRYLISLRSEHRRDFLTLTAAVIFVGLTALGITLLFQDLEGDNKSLVQSTTNEDATFQSISESPASPKLNISVADSDPVISSTLTTQLTNREFANTTIIEQPIVTNKQISNTPITTSQATKNVIVQEKNEIATTQKIVEEKPKETQTTLKKDPETTINEIIKDTPLDIIAHSFAKEVPAGNAEIQLSINSDDFCAESYSYTLTSENGDKYDNKVGANQDSCSTNWTVNLVALVEGETYILDFIVNSTNGRSESKRIEWTHSV